MLLSGGIDSATCLYLLGKEYDRRAITFSYRGISKAELNSAKVIGESAGLVEHRFVRLPDLRESGDIPGGRFYRMPPTYIPMRNAIFYSFAASYAEEVRARVIVGGHNRDDLAVFEDTKEEFFTALQGMIMGSSVILRRIGTRIKRPLKAKTKAQVIRLASRLGVPFELTWSCHRGRQGHCWECQGCISRMEAFKGAGITDPLRTPRRRGKIS